MSASLALVFAVGLVLTPSSKSTGDVPPPSALGNVISTGVRIHTLGRGALEGYQREADRAALPQAKPPFLVFASTANCVKSTPDSRIDDASCTNMDAPCVGNTAAQGLGPAVKVFRSRVDQTGKPVDRSGAVIAAAAWEYLGVTCFPDLVPGHRPALTMAQIQAAFHNTDFAHAALHVQPEGNLTLVTLPTYFQLRWPASGFGPDEIDAVDPVRMSGFQVEIRPRLASVTYVFGDGATAGPTQSLGGPYPTGDVIHAYRNGGRFETHADVTYRGQYRVAGGAWLDIPGDVTITGTTRQVEVKTAEARLYGNPG
ncbi:hypothetical protein [Pedococcus sp. 5OH_020]|uniref:hypothetical protein n=1 Tax=Pedococcus sp. 5OH_020 TaxID=2989814 RepID=UPI0022E9EC8C|nr:hypothetical protein [Pedococcus sp. 5OH_020]